MKLIDADALREKFKNVDANGINLELDGYALKCIDDAPTIERKKGKWNCSDDMYESGVCSVCEWDTGEPYVNCKKWFNYCPNCGARMER